MESNDRVAFAGTCSELTKRILACAFEVHSRLGAGLLENAYRDCLVHLMRKRGMSVETEVPISIQFDGISIAMAYRADVIVEGRVLLELKAMDGLQAVHNAQARTYLNHSGAEVALLLNFNVQNLVQGIRRFQRRRMTCRQSRPA